MIEMCNVQGLQNIKTLNEKFVFYYDETNNISKLSLLKEKYFNIGLDNVYKNFVLGGVCLKERVSQEKIDELKNNLKLQSIKDIKLKHIAKGDFLECLSSNKLNIFLKWVYENSYLHYSSLNILFWSIVDIIDSSIYLNTEFIPYHFGLKAILYEIIKVNYEDFIPLFIEYEYPNIKREKANEFLDKMIRIIQMKYKKINIESLKIEKEIFYSLTKNLIKLLERSKNKELPFIMDEKNNVLINSLSDLYLRPIYTFVNSKHFFDEEDRIKKFFEHFKFVYKGREIKVKFVNSKDNEFIQFSDVIIGIIGKMYEYLNKNSIMEIEKDLNSLNNIKKSNVALLKKIIIKSDKYCELFIHTIEPLTEKRKFEFVLDKV